MSGLPANPPKITKNIDGFRRQLTELPAFRALLRAVEADFYTDLPMPSPCLIWGVGMDTLLQLHLHANLPLDWIPGGDPFVKRNSAIVING